MSASRQYTVADITGMMLAGGRGSRMGHVDKGLQAFRGSTMARHVLERLAPQVGTLAINANQNDELYAQLGAPVWRDDLQGFEGPLAGLATGLRLCTTPLLATVPCDSPFLPSDLVARLLIALNRDNADLALAQTEDTGEAGVTRVQQQPVFALVNARSLPILSAYLDGGGRRMDGWYQDIRVARVTFEDASAFRNINTLPELQHYEGQQ